MCSAAADLLPAGHIKTQSMKWKVAKRWYYSAVLVVSMWGGGRGPKLIAEKNKTLPPWHYKRSKSSKRSPLPYSHTRQYWHLVFLWSFALIKKRQKNSCPDCNLSVFVSRESCFIVLRRACVWWHLHQGNQVFWSTARKYVYMNV